MLILALAAAPLVAQIPQTPEDLIARNLGPRDQVNKAFPPHKIIGNVYYVGSQALGTFLITTPEGHILINSDYEVTVPVIKAGVEQLGFKFTDIKILLISHAHWDHDAGSAMVKRLTGAQYMVMDGDVPVVETGGKLDFHYGAMVATHYPVAKVDRVLHDGDEVKLGNVTLVARLTAGQIGRASCRERV